MNEWFLHTRIVDQLEIRALIFDNYLRFPFGPGDCCHLCSCLIRYFHEGKEVLKEGVLIQVRNRAAVGIVQNAWGVVHKCIQLL